MTEARDGALLVGGYTGGRPGAVGVARVRLSGGVAVALDPVASVPEASFLIAAGAWRHVVSETDPGALWTLRTDGVPTAVLSTGGVAPCHVEPVGRWLVVSHYGRGGLVCVAATPDGATRLVGALRFDDDPLGPVGDRQDASHVHSALGVADDRLLCADLGTDRVSGIRVDAASGLHREWSTALPPGTGPRHLARLDADLVAVVGELDGAVHVLEIDGGTLRSSAAPRPTAVPSHLIAQDGVVHVAERGSGVIRWLRVHSDQLVPAGEHTGGVGWPRHFLRIADRLYVAGQHSATIALDATGAITGVLATVETGGMSPACLLRDPAG